MTANDWQYRIIVDMVDNDGRPHVAAWLNGDGDPTQSMFIASLLPTAERVHDQLARGVHPDQLGAVLTGYARVSVSPIRVYRRWSHDEPYRFHHDHTRHGRVEYPNGFATARGISEPAVDERRPVTPPRRVIERIDTLLT